MNQSVNANSF